MSAAVTDHDVQHALALSDLGVLLLVIIATVAVLWWLIDRARPDRPLDGSRWEPEQPRIVAQRSVYDQDHDTTG